MKPGTPKRKNGSGLPPNTFYTPGTYTMNTVKIVSKMMPYIITTLNAVVTKEVFLLLHAKTFDH